MTHATSSTLPSLGLPPSGLSTAQEPHPDSEEFVRHERRRVASELDTIQSPNASLANPSREPSTTPSYQHYQDTRSRGSDRNPSTIWRRTATPSASDITTIPDSEGPEANDTRRYRLQRQATHWYDPVVRIWTSQISITIDEGSHRDHLGKLSMSQSMLWLSRN
ncbi:hypothetical protein BU24DRAFT_234965 [Aaosphaeria arxii CBS 175.79]|uniref:Uncharacterized protein n=1 Tax=Aaosphaeria arxii CBS 175.79 TaxID=1450172 RepID=A0A6A5XJ85_9PLEO|nr:uncharacterized protein BU24DRAFT_234965 [Aaosphaeria arxii CBS 175.79]KAF2013325.1 hypothetical protein BU24DRAFT_234965 [Aaosphaeria arxii CBS 175.79]